MKNWLFLFLGFGSVAWAADFTVEDGETVTTTQRLSDSNDVGLIESGGTISTTGIDAVIMNSLGGSVTNQTCTNNGTIETTGNSADGILNAPGGESATITNSGTISTTGGSATDIINFGTSCTITNSGTISTTGFIGDSIHNTGASCTITNSGSISTTGDIGRGILNTGASCTIMNSGFISTTGANTDGILDTGDNNHLINSGTLKSVQSHAINFTGDNPSVTLKRGSNLQGSVESSAAALNVTVEKGLNQRLTITDSSNGFGSLNINQPFVTVGNTETLATVDPTSFVMQSDILEDLSDSILDAIYPNRDNFLYCCFPCGSAWVAGIGTVRTRERDDIETNNSQGGFLAGVDCNLCGTNALGLFVGGSWGNGRVEDDTASANTESYFAGLTYESLCCNTFLASALAAGYFQSNNRRTVMFNLAANGEETAKAKAEGGMLTAEFYAARWLMRPCSFRPLLAGTLRYAGLFLGGYDESGSSADLFVKNRHISLIKPKLDLAFTKSGCFYKRHYYLAPYIGVAGRFQVAGNNFDSELLGQDLYFETAGPKNLAEFLYGMYGSLSTGCYTLFFHVQGLKDSEDSSRFLGEGGLNYRF